jgi:hypothetical protein
VGCGSWWRCGAPHRGGRVRLHARRPKRRDVPGAHISLAPYPISAGRCRIMRCLTFALPTLCARVVRPWPLSRRRARERAGRSHSDPYVCGFAPSYDVIYWERVVFAMLQKEQIMVSWIVLAMIVVLRRRAVGRLIAARVRSRRRARTLPEGHNMGIA